MKVRIAKLAVSKFVKLHVDLYKMMEKKGENKNEANSFVQELYSFFKI